MRAIADVGNTRMEGEVLKQNPLTTLMKIDPQELVDDCRRYFMENGVSTEEYWRQLKELGVSRKGITKRHNLKHRVSII